MLSCFSPGIPHLPPGCGGPRGLSPKAEAEVTGEGALSPGMAPATAVPPATPAAPRRARSTSSLKSLPLSVFL